MRLFLNKIYSRHPRYRRLLLVIFDLVILQLSLFISFWITSENNDIWSKVINLSWIFYFSFISAIPIYFFTGQYRSLTKYFDIHLIYYIGYRNLIVTFLIYLFGLLNSLILPNFSTFILVWILITSISIFYRLILRDFLYSLSKKKAKKIIKVSIYGTGSFAAQLAVSLRQNGNYKVLNFIDDDQSLWNRNLLGLQIKPLNHLETMPAKPDQILLAVPDLSRSLKKKKSWWCSS